MRIGVPSQAAAGEPRVALVPDVIRRLSQHELEIVVESGAGEGSHLPDQAFADAGATIGSAADAWGSDVVAVVRAPSATDLELMDRGKVLIGFLNPLTDADTARRLPSAGGTAFAMGAIPRLTRAPAMDAPPSQRTA